MHLRYLGLLGVTILCLMALPWSVGETMRHNAVIAVVNGEAVKYAAVKVAPGADLLLMRFRRAHGRDPETEADREAMERERRAREIRNLSEFIRAAVRQQQTARFGIDPTEEEVEERWQRYRRERKAEGEPIDVNVMLRQGRENLRQLLKALEEVVDEGQDADAVYQRRLVDKMSREEWRLRLQYEGTPERRELLERLLALPDNELFKPHEAFRKVLVMERLDKAIEEDLVAKNPEFAEYVRLATTDPGNQKVQSKGPNYRAAKRYEWWQQRYREAQIEIKDDRFKDALKHVYE